MIFPKWFKKIFNDEHHWDEIAFFRTMSLFDGLRTSQLSRIIMAMQKRVYQPGEVIFEEGQVGKAVFILRYGQVELTRKIGADATRTLAVIEKGHVFGEMALLEQMPRTATARVAEESQIYLLYTATLDSLVMDEPAIGARLMRNMAIMLSSLLRKANLDLEKYMIGKDKGGVA